MAEQRFSDGINPDPIVKPLLQRGAEKYVEMWKDNFAERQSFAGAVSALAREAIKDVRQTMNEVFFGQGEHMSEPGTPFNPTQIQVTKEAGNFHGYEDMQAEAAHRAGFQREDRDKGMGH
jgi:hypothetical protein